MSFSTFHVSDLSAAAPTPPAPPPPAPPSHHYAGHHLPPGQLPLPVSAPWPAGPQHFAPPPPIHASPAPALATANRGRPGRPRKNQQPAAPVAPEPQLSIFGSPEWASGSPEPGPGAGGADPDDPIQLLLTKTWKTFEEAKNALMESAESAGFGVSKLRPGNYDKYTNEPRSHSYECYKGRTTTKAPGQVNQHRKRTSIRVGCPWKCKLRKRVRDDGWTFALCEGGETHSHPLTDTPEKINSHLRRKLTPGMVCEMMILKTLPRVSHADVANKMNEHYKEINLNLSRYHVNNTLKKERDRILRAFGEDPDKGYGVDE